MIDGVADYPYQARRRSRPLSSPQSSPLALAWALSAANSLSVEANACLPLGSISTTFIQGRLSLAAAMRLRLFFTESVMSMTLLKRRKLLKEVLDGQGRVVLSDAVAAEGVAFFDAAREMGIEAVIAKRKDSVYLPGGHSPSWLLVQDVPRQDVVVVGFIPDALGGAFEALLVGTYVDHQVTYAGAVGGGFDQRTERLLAQALPGLRNGADAPAGAGRVPQDAVWVRPELVASVKFSEWTPEGTLRFPIFVGMHPEVDARACVRQPLLPPRAAIARPRKLKIELPQLPFAAPEAD